MRVIPSTLLVLLSAVAVSAPLHAQVKEAEPFGGRPFGAPPGTQPVDNTSATAAQGTAMGAQGTSSVTAPGTQNMGTPPSMAIAPATVVAPPAPPTQPAAPPPSPAPAPAPAPHAQAPSPAAAQGAQGAQGGASTAGVQSSPTTAVPGSATPSPSAPGPGMSAPAPAAASVTPPFGAANRNAPAVPASTAQQPPVRGLPADAPKLVISGSVYSPDPAKRILIVNGQMVREGADLGQGVVVHEVRRESAVLGFKGSNYTVMF